MKWIALIFAVLLCAVAVFFLFKTKDPTPGSPQAVAHRYIDAVMEEDEDTIRELCAEYAVGEALRLAPHIRRLVSRGNDRYQPMKAQAPRQGVAVIVGTELVGIELIEADGEWKIVLVRLADF